MAVLPCHVGGSRLYDAPGTSDGRILALYFAPFMPRTSAEVFRRLGLGDIAAVDDIEAATAWGQLPAGNEVEKGDPLFPRLKVEDIQL